MSGAVVRKAVLCCCMCLLALTGAVDARAGSLSLQRQIEGGIQQFAVGDYIAAEHTFSAVFDEDPMYAEVNYYLGRCAYEQQRYEEAYAAFDRALIDDPYNAAVLVEQGKTLFQLGNYAQARQMLLLASSVGGDAETSSQVDDWLMRINAHIQRSFFSGTLALGLTYDDNVRSAPSVDRISSVTGDIVLSRDSGSETSDMLWHMLAGINHRYLLGEQVDWLSRMQVYGAWYNDENDLDYVVTSLATGPSWRLGRSVLTVAGQFDHMLSDQKSYLRRFGLYVGLNTSITSDWSVNVVARVMDKNYYDYDDMDSTVLGGGIDLTWRSVNGRLVLSGYAADDNADDDRNSYVRTQAGVTFYGNLPLQSSYSVGYRYRQDKYEDKELRFDDHRIDRQHLLSCSFSIPLWQAADCCRKLIFNMSYSYYDVHSSIKLYDYDKNIVDSNLAFTF